MIYRRWSVRFYCKEGWTRWSFFVYSCGGVTEYFIGVWRCHWPCTWNLLCPLRFRASSWCCLALSNDFLLQEIPDLRRLIAEGSCLRIEGGWFDLSSIYWVVLFGFLLGQYDPSVRFSVTSKKFTMWRLLWMVIPSPWFLKCFMISFCFLSAWGSLEKDTWSKQAFLSETNTSARMEPTSLSPFLM